MERYTVSKWDEFGELIERSNYYPDGNLMKILFKRDTAYDGDGNIIMDQTYRISTLNQGLVDPYERHEYRYDEYGNVIEEWTWRWDEGEEYSTHKKYEYRFFNESKLSN